MRRTFAWAFAAMCLSCEAVLGIAPLPEQDAAAIIDGASDVVVVPSDASDGGTKEGGECGHTCGDAGYGCVNGGCGNEVVDLSAGQFHACAVLRGGEVWCWGNNDYEQCGGPGGDVACAAYGTYCRAPRKVAGISNAVGVASSAVSTCALNSSGAVFCWGSNYNQELGNDAGAQSSPIQVNLPDKATQVAAGYAMGCAVTVKNELWCWGRNECGQMGLGFVGASDGGANDDFAPTFVAADVVSVRMSYPNQPTSTCAIRTDGGASCWGYNVYGSLPVSGTLCYGTGGNACNPSSKPYAVPNKTITKIAPGLTLCAVASGEVWCSGVENDNGSLGTGDTSGVGTNAPILASSLPNETFVDVASSGAHACALASTGEVYCWGYPSRGEIGAGYDDAGLPPSKSCAGQPCSPSATRVGTFNATLVRVGGNVSYAADDGGLWAWGWNDIDQLGHPFGTNGDHQNDAGTWFNAIPTRVALP